MVPHSGTPVRAHRLRPLNPPRRVLVELGDRGLPCAVLEPRQVLHPAETSSPRPSGSDPAGEWTRKEIESVVDVWKVDDEWWRQPISRRYVEVVMNGGKHTVLYLDLTTNEWFEQTP